MPESAELVAAADTLAEASLYKEAISTYSKAIELHPTAPAYFVKRYLPLPAKQLILVPPRINAPVISMMLSKYLLLQNIT